MTLILLMVNIFFAIILLREFFITQQRKKINKDLYFLLHVCYFTIIMAIRNQPYTVCLLLTIKHIFTE